MRAGDVISPWYDPMIAKVIVYGPTRATALLQLERALAACQVAGTVTNLAFLRRLSRQADFVAGGVDTGLIDRDVAALSARPVPCSRTRALAAMGALGLTEARPAEGFHLWAPLAWDAGLRWQDEDVAARVEARGGAAYRVTVGESAHDVAREAAGWRVDGEVVGAEVAAEGGDVHVFWGDVYSFAVPDPLDVAAAAGAGSGVVEAPMPGLVKAVFVEAGAQVAAGDRLAILEAMKMEHTLRAPRDGVVAEVLAAEGAQVEAGAALVRLEEEA